MSNSGLSAAISVSCVTQAVRRAGGWGVSRPHVHVAKHADVAHHGFDGRNPRTEAVRQRALCATDINGLPLQHQSAPVQALLDFLVERFAKVPWH